MPWPFTNPSIPPNFDSTLKAIPQAGETLSLAVLYLLGLRIANSGNVDRTVTVTDAAGNVIVPAVDIPGKTTVQLDVPFEPLLGLIWSASGAGLVGHAWGYQ